MDRDWLLSFLRGCARLFDRTAAEERLEAFRRSLPETDAKEFIRRYLEHRLRERGVVYGTPLASEQTITEHTQKGYRQRRAVFLALQQVQVELAMEVGCFVAHCTEGLVQVGELLVCYALLCRKPKLAGKINALLPQLPIDAEPPKELVRLSRKVAAALADRSHLTGNPLLGLPMHNSFNYGDAKTYCRLAVAYFEAGAIDGQAVDRVLAYQDRERMLLIQALLGLTKADRQIGLASRRIMIAQIKSAGLSWRTRRALVAMLKEPVPALAVAAAVEDDRTRDFLIEQVFLGAMLDGYFSDQERDYIADLAGWLGVPPGELIQREAEVVLFYEQHQAYLDLFTVGTAVRSNRQQILDRISQGLADDMGLIVEEIRAKGDLAESLYRASSGEKLEPGEWKRVRSHLVDMARSVPSLAIFTLPGGAVLLPILFRLLPDGLKPRSFAERDRKRRSAKSDDPEDVI